ncbi:MAG TPA: FecR domain-containing protein [Polyangiaceae bacterium]|nr:FecR domain-containing protein [Polyangiaceae bacterium]
MNGPDRAEPRLAALVALVRAAVKAPSAVELDRGLAALRARMARHEARRGWRPRPTLVAAAVVVVLAAVLWVRPWRRAGASQTPLAVTRIEGGRLLEGGYLSEGGGNGVALYFNEGSQFVLTPGTRARLRAVTADGSRIALDHGTASFRITRNLARSWAVEAGPFVVTVRGTEFTVLWSPTTETFEVKLRKGRVVVTGPIVGEELVLRPGQDLTVDLHRQKTVISEGAEQTEEAAAAAPPLSGAAPPEASAGTSAATSSPSPRPPASATPSPARHWREAIASGQWDKILADVERDGVDASLRTLSSEELFALADAARYRRRPELARAALLAQRERFPASPRAFDAAFLLGRVEESRGNKALAVERYDEYLARAPGGTYAAEALGRKMILIKDLEGPESARHLAEEYLARFPAGSHAEAARTLRKTP